MRAKRCLWRRHVSAWAPCLGRRSEGFYTRSGDSLSLSGFQVREDNNKLMDVECGLGGVLMLVFLGGVMKLVLFGGVLMLLNEVLMLVLG